MLSASTIHLIGIGGTGLSAIARVLVESGYQVTGSDQHLSPLASSLMEAGVPVFIGHKAENVGNADLVVISSAIAEGNVEVQAARARGIPVMKRSDFLSELMMDKFVIAIAGTHGKTTTTAMVAWILSQLGQDPAFIIGGVSKDLKTNAHAGSGRFFVIEADEYDRMFLGLRPDIAVITNIEHDHPDYFPDFDDFLAAFVEFTDRVRPDGLLLANGDDAGARKLIGASFGGERRIITFGLAELENDYTVESFTLNADGGFSFDVRLYAIPEPGPDLISVYLKVPGQHNILNALAALAVSHQIGLPVEKAAAALREFSGTGRRFDVRGEAGGILVIDDYAHHPTEIRAVLSAARMRYPDRKLWVVWQPHTYSRTKALAVDFSFSFENADHVLVTEVFPSRESPPADGFSANDVVRLMVHPDVHFIPALDEVTDYLLAHLKDDDVLLVLSAGDADQISTNVLTALDEREQSHA